MDFLQAYKLTQLNETIRFPDCVQSPTDTKYHDLPNNICIIGLFYEVDVRSIHHSTQEYTDMKKHKKN